MKKQVIKFIPIKWKISNLNHSLEPRDNLDFLFTRDDYFELKQNVYSQLLLPIFDEV